LTLPEFFTASWLKVKICQGTGTAAQSQRLFVGDLQLDDDDILSKFWPMDPLLPLDVCLVVVPVPSVFSTGDSDSDCECFFQETAVGMLMGGVRHSDSSDAESN